MQYRNQLKPKVMTSNEILTQIQELQDEKKAILLMSLEQFAITYNCDPVDSDRKGTIEYLDHEIGLLQDRYDEIDLEQEERDFYEDLQFEMYRESCRV